MVISAARGRRPRIISQRRLLSVLRLFTSEASTAAGGWPTKMRTGGDMQGDKFFLLSGFSKGREMGKGGRCTMNILLLVLLFSWFADNNIISSCKQYKRRLRASSTAEEGISMVI